jgi:putative hydrolase of the HAD superfamily
VLELLDVQPGDAAMVGDTLHEDIEGALSVGMSAVLVDRAGRYPEIERRLPDLGGLAAALGLE